MTFRSVSEEHVRMTSAPRARKIPHEIMKHDDLRIDEFFWLREKESPEVLGLLEKENEYTRFEMRSHATDQEAVFQELKSRILEDDQDVPVRKGDYFYYSRMVAGQQYPVFCRKRQSLTADEEILLDCNELAKGHSYFSLGVFEISPNHDILAYGVDTLGSEHYTVQFKRLNDQTLLSDVLTDVGGALEWSADQSTVFYNRLDENDRPDRVLRHRMGEDSTHDVLIYQELDPQLFVSVSKSKDERYLFLNLSGKVTSEIRFLPSNQPMGSFVTFWPRVRGVLYSIESHLSGFFVLTNDQVPNFRLLYVPANRHSLENAVELLRGTPELYLEGFEIFDTHLVSFERQKGKQEVRVCKLNLSRDHQGQIQGKQWHDKEHFVAFPEPTYSVGPSGNAEFKSQTLRLAYSSLVTPTTVFDYDLKLKTKEIKKVREVPGGYEPTDYVSERLLARAPDGTQVPISLVYKKGFERNGQAPLYLYGYGSYGHSLSPSFSTSRLSLLDRGFVYAIAHTRGGEELGRNWYENGKFLKKKNTFSDFIACAEHLIQNKYTRQQNIVAVGGSAGGMLVGAVINDRPELFLGAVAHVPFVDVVNTMLDETLPLTALEYEEWGNPNEKTYYDYMKSYSPYDNVKRQAYPHLLVTAGLNDRRVTYWEPAKWVQRLRDHKTDQNLLLFHVHLDAGHSGASGRYNALKDLALEYTFIFKIFGLLPVKPK